MFSIITENTLLVFFMQLTEKQKITYEFIKQYILDHEIAPTEAEIAQGIGIKSRGVAHRYVMALENAGLITIVPNRRRNIRLVKEDSSLDTFSVPILGKIAAGQPIEAVPLDYGVNLSDKLLGANKYLLEVQGDSMIGDNICDGDYIICESCTHLITGEILVILIGEEDTTLKRCKKISDTKIELIPSNPNLSSKIYDANSIRIQGRYLGLMRFN